MNNSAPPPPPPPPPPPHGSNPRSGGNGSGGLPPGNYDIFIIPPHSSGSGFLYLPSLQPHRNSFLAGVACTLVVVGVWQIIGPVLRQWVGTIVASGGQGVVLLILAIGVAGWALGRTQTEGSGAAGGGGAMPGGSSARAGAGGGAGAGANAYGKQQQQQQQRQQPNSSWGNANGGTSSAWEQAREETRRREEDRKRTEELKKKQEEATKKKEEASRAAKAAAEKEKWEQMRAREKEAREREARERLAKERAEKDKGRFGVGEKTDPYAGSNVSPNRGAYQKPSARSYPGTEAGDEEHSYRPYDSSQRQAPKTTSGSSYGSGPRTAHSSAASHSTARSSPPPSHRGPYTTKDPDKIVIKGVYLFSNMFAKPVAQLISGVGHVTDGLILRLTTEGCFVDDDVRGIGQREWDVKAWGMKLIETGTNGQTHVLRASVRDTEGKKYVFVLPESESWKVNVGLQRLRRGTQVRSLGVNGIPAGEVKRVLDITGW